MATRYLGIAALLLAFAGVLPASQAAAQAAGQTPVSALVGDGVVIAMPINVAAGVPTDRAVKGMKDVGAFIHKQAGFIGDVLMVSTFPDNRPSHVYVSIWRDRADWEALAAQQAFLDLLESRGALFDWNLAEVYRAVK